MLKHEIAAIIITQQQVQQLLVRAIHRVMGLVLLELSKDVTALAALHRRKQLQLLPSVAVAASTD